MSKLDYYYYPNRTLCDVLEEMRKMHETRNYAALLAMIEEVQHLANKMEAALGDAKDIRKLSEQRSELKAEVMKLREEKKILGGTDASE